MILLSACLAGVSCKYNGGDNYRDWTDELLRLGQVVPICPEQLGGLPAPRPPAEIRGGDGQAVLDERAEVIDAEGKDRSAAFVRGAEHCLGIALTRGVTIAILKERSPSCGVKQIYDGSFSGRLIDGCGVTAALLMNNGIEIISDEDAPQALPRLLNMAQE